MFAVLCAQVFKTFRSSVFDLILRELRYNPRKIRSRTKLGEWNGKCGWGGHEGGMGTVGLRVRKIQFQITLNRLNK